MGTSNRTPATATPVLTLASANTISKSLIKQVAQKKRIMINPVTIANPVAGQQIQFLLQNVGLYRGGLVEFSCTLSNTDGSLTASLSDFGPPNIFSSILYNDFSNTQRILTSGAHMYMNDCNRRRNIMGSAFTNDNPGTFGSNWKPINAPATIASGSTGTVKGYIYLPAAYDPMGGDYRGAVFSNITNATQSLNFTIGTTSVAAGTDSVYALYGGTVNLSITSLTITVYQDIMDQLPQIGLLNQLGISAQDWVNVTGNTSGYLLPDADMRWMYEFKNFPFTSVVQGQENSIPFTNQRQFLSVILQYNNSPQPSTTARTLGTDITQFRQTAANSYEWFKVDPLTVAYEARAILGDDFPKGFYLFDYRQAPINTANFGNVSLNFTPSLANTGANCIVYTEDFSLLTNVPTATSLGV